MTVETRVADAMVHPTAVVSERARLGKGVQIWCFSQVREGASIGDQTRIGKSVYVDSGVCIGGNVKIQNNVSIYHGVTIEDGVFIGPHVCFTNDTYPRAVNLDGSLKTDEDWVLSTTIVKRGASIGANATILCGRTIGSFAMVGAGAVVTNDVPDFGLVLGVPARLVGYVCLCGRPIGENPPLKYPPRCKGCVAGG